MKLYSQLIVLFVLLGATGADAIEGGASGDPWDDREISLMGTASVSDLYMIIKDWRKVSGAMKQYVASKSNMRLSGCDIENLTIESIKGVSRYSQNEIKEYHPDIAKLFENTNRELQSLVTTHPCFAAKGDRNITWYFFSKGRKYSVIEHAEVL